MWRHSPWRLYLRDFILSLLLYLESRYSSRCIKKQHTKKNFLWKWTNKYSGWTYQNSLNTTRNTYNTIKLFDVCCYNTQQIVLLCVFFFSARKKNSMKWDCEIDFAINKSVTHLILMCFYCAIIHCLIIIKTSVQ